MAYSSTAALATRQQPPSVMPSPTPARFLPPSISWHGYRHCAGVGCCPAMRRWRGKPSEALGTREAAPRPIPTQKAGMAVHAPPERNPERVLEKGSQ